MTTLLGVQIVAGAGARDVRTKTGLPGVRKSGKTESGIRNRNGNRNRNRNRNRNGKRNLYKSRDNIYLNWI